MSCFESMRKLLMSRLEARGELTDEEILEIIDDLVLSRSREFLLTLKEKEGLRKDLFILSASWMCCRNWWKITQ